MNKTRTLWSAICLGLVLMLGLTSPSALIAADPQLVVGNWEGTLDPGAQPKKRILIHITADQDGSLRGTIDYPDENSSGILITAITYKDLALHLESAQIQGSYEGTMNKDNQEINGIWKQRGAGVNLILMRIL